MSIKDELIAAELVNQNTDEEAIKIIGKLDKLDVIQQSIISGFATLLNKGAVLFLESSTFVIPDGVTEVAITGCGAGGVVYAGEGCIRKKVSVKAGEQIEVKCGTNIASEFGDYVYLGNATSTENGNSDILGIGAILGIKGSNGTAGQSVGTGVGGSGGSGGHGGMFGFGGGGGGGGRAGFSGYWGGDSGTGGKGSGSTVSANIAGQTVSLNAGTAGWNGTNGYKQTIDDNTIYLYGGNGGRGGNGGGFGGGAGAGGKYGTADSGSWYTNKRGNDGANGTGAAGFILVEWGVDV